MVEDNVCLVAGKGMDGPELGSSSSQSGGANCNRADPPQEALDLVGGVTENEDEEIGLGSLLADLCHCGALQRWHSG